MQVQAVSSHPRTRRTYQRLPVPVVILLVGAVRCVEVSGKAAICLTAGGGGGVGVEDAVGGGERTRADAGGR